MQTTHRSPRHCFRLRSSWAWWATRWETWRQRVRAICVCARNLRVCAVHRGGAAGGGAGGQHGCAQPARRTPLLFPSRPSCVCLLAGIAPPGTMPGRNFEPLAPPPQQLGHPPEQMGPPPLHHAPPAMMPPPQQPPYMPPPQSQPNGGYQAPPPMQPQYMPPPAQQHQQPPPQYMPPPMPAPPADPRLASAPVDPRRGPAVGAAPRPMVSMQAQPPAMAPPPAAHPAHAAPPVAAVAAAIAPEQQGAPAGSCVRACITTLPVAMRPLLKTDPPPPRPPSRPPDCAALLQQVLSLTPEQVDLLPPQQKAQVQALQAQLRAQGLV